MQVAPFFFQLESEARELKLMPSGCAVNLGNKAAEVRVLESGFVFEAMPPGDLKAPTSVEETKVPFFCHANTKWAG